MVVKAALLLLDALSYVYVRRSDRFWADEEMALVMQKIKQSILH